MMSTSIRVLGFWSLECPGHHPKHPKEDAKIPIAKPNLVHSVNTGSINDFFQLLGERNINATGSLRMFIEMNADLKTFRRFIF